MNKKKEQHIYFYLSALLVIIMILLLIKNTINKNIEYKIISNLVEINKKTKEKEVEINFLTASNLLKINKNKVTLSGDIINEKACVNLLYEQQKLNNNSILLKNVFKENLNKCIEYRKHYIYNDKDKNTLILYTK